MKSIWCVHRVSVRPPFKRKAKAFFPSAEDVSTNRWLVKIMVPAATPARSTPAVISITTPTGRGDVWRRLICRSKNSRSWRFMFTSTSPSQERIHKPCICSAAYDWWTGAQLGENRVKVGRAQAQRCSKPPLECTNTLSCRSEAVSRI
jgi:hypothetical protein